MRTSVEKVGQVLTLAAASMFGACQRAEAPKPRDLTPPAPFVTHTHSWDRIESSPFPGPCPVGVSGGDKYIIDPSNGFPLTPGYHEFELIGGYPFGRLGALLFLLDRENFRRKSRGYDSFTPLHDRMVARIGARCELYNLETGGSLCGNFKDITFEDGHFVGTKFSGAREVIHNPP